MKASMGASEAKGVLLGTFFGFISSSCSFAALATTKALLKKKAGFIPSMAFLLASTNLVIELGIVISIFLSWQFIVGEYVGGILLILLAWLIIKLTRPKKLIDQTYKRLGAHDEEVEQTESWKDKIRSKKIWRQIARQYFMEWDMVWKDVTIGFTLAGVIAAFVPASFFETLFIHTGEPGTNHDFWSLLQHSVIGPVAAFCTFIGSMGNIPLASLLYSNGVSFAGIMAFIFSDLVVFPVLRINAAYYGWKMSLYIAFVLFGALVITSLLLHYGMDLAGWLPQSTGIDTHERQYFKIDYTLFLNIAFLLLSLLLAYLAFWKKSDHHHEEHDHDHGSDKGIVDIVLKYLAYLSYGWLLVGIILILTEV